jgi:hypothetical protein
MSPLTPAAFPSYYVIVAARTVPIFGTQHREMKRLYRSESGDVQLFEERSSSK